MPAVIAYTDGGARGNPGPSGFGAHIVDQDGNQLAQLKGALGQATNNVAEYHGLIAALEWAVAEHCADLIIRADSELLVKQMRGEYRVKNEGLQPLHARATRLARQVGRVQFEHVRREQNREADRLANLAMDEAAQALAAAAGSPNSSQ